LLYSTAAQVSFVALVAVTLFVLLMGERWGRLSAGLHAVNWVLVAVFQRRHEPQLVFQTGDFVIDLIGAVLACAIAVASRRTWAASLAAFQLLGLVNYLIVLVDRRVLHRAFWTTAYLWEAGALASLAAAGVVGLRGRRRRLTAPPGPAPAVPAPPGPRDGSGPS
jgi:hypothetical protein